MQNFKVAIMGTTASFHDIAAQKIYGRDVNKVECKTFKHCCEVLKQKEADFAVIAIENTLAGSILPNYSLICEYGFQIIGEVYVKIELSLLALSGVRMEEIECIQSHPMALAQCSNFLARHPNIKIIEESDTASCVKKISEGRPQTTAAIANVMASEQYKVPVLVGNIENNKQNFTRFNVLSRGEGKPDRTNKASLSFRLKHENGCLAEVLYIFKQYDIGLSKIQSIPVVGYPNQYSFYVDVEWTNYENYKNAIQLITKKTTKFSILGEYVKAVLTSS